ncbi:hypothetical protein F7725_002443 [Dissostichus mawsoni]|uniref:LON peptidase N-terminal domain and ring finger 2 n=1 Tax=Dissostichus mawsoni TaxID=36200 RepID=A0A7J5Y2D1_DISMA|nr:hypothetical protein F7725_002443 [Dissostichus mawsoni]
MIYSISFSNMGTRVEMFVHPLSNPGAAGICPEMLEVAEEVNRAGDYSLAAEIYTSQLADLQHPDRGLCLRKADCLTQAGRISEALDSYCTAASLGKLHPEELPLLVDTIARTLREKELGFPGPGGKSTSSSEEEGVESDGECGDDEVLDLFSCRLCKCLLHEPTTVECGHTFCKICLEDEAITECVQCKEQFNEKKDGLPNDRRLDVVLSGLLDKLFATESKARKFWIEGQVLWGEKNQSEALEKYNAAVDLAPSIGRLLCQRAELHVEMRNFSLAAHSLKATTLSEAGRNDEALQEYLMCVALKPNWTKVKLQAQKVLSEVFSSVFENGNMPTPLHPLQGGTLSSGGQHQEPGRGPGCAAGPPRLFYEPVATPCGHTFCLKCLERCLDHKSNCPLCKENLSEYLATRGYNKTLLMEERVSTICVSCSLNQEVPVFVCTMAPTIPCPLHVFEPRYRLMIRRSMETGTKQFGMCIADELKGFADYGCMLEVRDVKFFPDGRSVVDTIGVSRFKVLSHGQRDGYHTAKIEYLEDKKMHDAVYEQANNWFTSLKDNMKSQILSHFGDLPSNDPDPQNRAQLTILAMTSLKDRLIAIRRVLIFVTRRTAVQPK